MFVVLKGESEGELINVKIKLSTMSNVINQTIVAVTEFTSFESAWDAAIETRANFAAFQGMEAKINYMRQSQRWFVDANNELWHSYVTPDGLRIVTRAETYSILSHSAFQYIQIMVNPNPVSNPDRKGQLRLTGQYVNRQTAIKYSKDSEVFAFNK